MKKWLCIVMAALLASALCACGSGESETSDGSGSSLAEIVARPTPETNSSTSEQVEILVVTADGVNIRSDASTDSDVVSVASKDEAFYLVQKDAADGWHKIKYEGQEAYISADFSEVSSVTAEEAKQKIGEDSQESSEESTTESSTQESSAESSSEESSASTSSSGETSESSSSSSEVKAEEIRENEDAQRR